MLRDYQIDICSRVSEAFEHHRSVMVQMPTGTGKTMVLADTIKSASIVFSTVPILIVYPFLQKYFVQGVMIGAVKE